MVLWVLFNSGYGATKCFSCHDKVGKFPLGKDVGLVWLDKSMGNVEVLVSYGQWVREMIYGMHTLKKTG